MPRISTASIRRLHVRVLDADQLRFVPDVSTAYLINPATRTRTTLRLRGIPGAQYVTLAW